MPVRTRLMASFRVGGSSGLGVSFAPPTSVSVSVSLSLSLCPSLSLLIHNPQCTLPVLSILCQRARLGRPAQRGLLRGTEKARKLSQEMVVIHGKGGGVENRLSWRNWRRRQASC
jgi:hypothetical protein